jgi:catechol 2,3-dioxygenase-like lactoylglutathione lyase family enzyme
VIAIERLAFACEDAARLRAFWASVLGFEPEGEAAVDPDGEFPPLVFRAAAKTPTIEAPLHLDVNTRDPDAELERLLGLGARLVVRKQVRIGPIEEGWSILRDPEGNGFCLQGPDTRRERTYIGNVTFACAEPVPLGRFWREALGYLETDFPEELMQSILDAGIDPAELEAYADAVHPDGKRPRLLFQRRQKSPAPEPALRLELAADDVEAEVERLVALGAERLGGQRGSVDLADPDGNRFHLGAR